MLRVESLSQLATRMSTSMVADTRAAFDGLTSTCLCCRFSRYGMSRGWINQSIEHTCPAFRSEAPRRPHGRAPRRLPGGRFG